MLWFSLLFSDIKFAVTVALSTAHDSGITSQNLVYVFCLTVSPETKESPPTVGLMHNLIYGRSKTKNPHVLDYNLPFYEFFFK